MNTTPFNIHKVTLLSFEPNVTAKQIKLLFKNDIETQCIPDKAIKERKAEWFQFKKGARSEIHIIKPFKLKYNKLLKKMDEEQKNKHPLTFGIFENHVGIYVPNLTEIVNRIDNHNKQQKKNKTKHKKDKTKRLGFHSSKTSGRRASHQNKTLKTKKEALKQIQYVIFKRQDGLNQLYVDLHGCIDYLEIDSFNYDYKKTANQLEPIKFDKEIIKEIQQLEKLNKIKK